MIVRLTVAEAAAAARRHPGTIRRALEAGDLHGTQRTVRGRWLIHPDCLESWIDAQPCQHQPSRLRVAR